MDILDTLKSLGGYWHYEGGKYLAQLTSGKVSDTYINAAVLTSSPFYLEDAARNMIRNLRRELFPENQIMNLYGHWKNLHVCGPAMGGVTIAYEVARQLGGTAVFTEPEYSVLTEGAVQKAGQKLKRFDIPNNASVLFVEDVLTTGKSTIEMVKAARKTFTGCGCNGDCGCPRTKCLPYVLCLVNRSGSNELEFTSLSNEERAKPWKIVSLASVNARTWARVDEIEEDFWIHYATIAGGIQNRMIVESVRPKENWKLLTGGK